MELFRHRRTLHLSNRCAARYGFLHISALFRMRRVPSHAIDGARIRWPKLCDLIAVLHEAPSLSCTCLRWDSLHAANQPQEIPRFRKLRAEGKFRKPPSPAMPPRLQKKSAARSFSRIVPAFPDFFSELVPFEQPRPAGPNPE